MGAGGGVKRPPQQPAQPPVHPATGPCYRGNDTTRNAGRSDRQNAFTRRSTQREERVTVQGPVKKPQPDERSHGGGGGQRVALIHANACGSMSLGLRLSVPHCQGGSGRAIAFFFLFFFQDPDPPPSPPPHLLHRQVYRLPRGLTATSRRLTMNCHRVTAHCHILTTGCYWLTANRRLSGLRGRLQSVLLRPWPDSSQPYGVTCGGVLRWLTIGWLGGSVVKACRDQGRTWVPTSDR